MAKKAAPQPEVKGMTKTITCDCRHEFQDKVYGVQKRLHARTSGKNAVNWRCTVCGHEKG